MTDDSGFTTEIPTAELLGDESIAAQDVPVVVRRPIRVEPLPTRFAGTFVLPLTTEPTRLAPNPKQRRLTLMAFDQEIRLGDSQAKAKSDQAARWPKLVPLVLETRDELWIASATATTDLTVLVESWAE